MRVRYPIAAGSFYERNEEDLREEIEECFKHPFGPGMIPKVSHKEERKILGLISPHAGYMYSGPVAANGFYQVALDGPPKKVIIMGPNHTGFGPAVALSSDSAWQTPLGKVGIDFEIVQKLLSMGLAEAEDSAHRMEHSIEVQLPFLQYLFGSDFTFVPICILNQRLEVCEQLGKGLAQIIKEEDCLLIASSDFTHHETQVAAKEKDEKAIEPILEMEAELLVRVIDEYGVSMCGPGPIIALIVAAKQLRNTTAKLLSYRTSGDITGDFSNVVGYASFTFVKKGSHF